MRSARYCSHANRLGGEAKEQSAYPAFPDAWAPVLEKEGRMEAEKLILKVWD